MRVRPLISLVAILLISAFLLVYPIYVIRPFRHQDAGELAAALFITQYRLVVEILLVVIALVIAFSKWRAVGKLRNVGILLLTMLIAAAGFLSRINVYEKMFHPLDQPSFTTAAERKLDPDEQIIAVKINNAARAYPIRDISYHHIVNDTLGGRAIVATY